MAVVSRLPVVLVVNNSFQINPDDGLVFRVSIFVSVIVVSGPFEEVERDAYSRRIRDGLQKGTAPGDGAPIAALQALTESRDTPSEGYARHRYAVEHLA